MVYHPPNPGGDKTEYYISTPLLSEVHPLASTVSALWDCKGCNHPQVLMLAQLTQRENPRSGYLLGGL